MKKTLLIIMLGFWGLALFAQTQYGVTFKELPKDAQKYITKNYAGWAVDKCVQEDNAKQKMTSCDVFVSKGSEKLKLIFDKDGEFVKKETVTEQAKAQPAAAPTASPAAAPAATPAETKTAAPAAVPAAAPTETKTAAPAETKTAAPVPVPVPPVK
jgi:hypothetical protein